MIIYRVTTPSKKVYIGQTIHKLERRIHSHIYTSKKSNQLYFHKALRKYDLSKIVFEEIDKASSKEELNKKEIYWIEYYKSNDSRFGYNLTKGGDGAASYGDKNAMFGISMEQRLINKHGEALGRVKYQEWVEGQRIQSTNNNPMKGKHFTKIWIDKYGEEKAREMIKEKYSQIQKTLKETIDKDPNIKKIMKQQSSGKNNPMYGKSVYSIWLEKYGKEEADKRQEAFREKCRNRIINKKRTKKPFYVLWVERYGQEEGNKRIKEYKEKLRVSRKKRTNIN